MAELKIHSQIKSGDDAAFDLMFFGVEGTSYPTISDFIGSIPADDPVINLSIHSNGGLVDEGIAIYDAIRASGKEVSAVIEGSCDSIASVILLSAPSDKRSARPNASMVIHNPSTSPWAVGTDNPTADAFRAVAESLDTAKNRILDIYVDRTGTDRDTLSDLMTKETTLTAVKAKELGFISNILTPNTNLTKSKMANEKFKKAIAALKKVVVDLAPEDAITNMTLVTTAGAELVIERESGDPQVGDTASPDGEHTLDDGTVIVVAEGVITEIRGAGEDEDPTDEEPNEIEDLKKQITDLQAENATLKGQVLNKAQREILNRVSKLGGAKVLDKLESNYSPAKREAQPAKPVVKVENSIADAANAKMAELRAKKQK